MLRAPDPDVVELPEILEEMVRDAQRAAAVIDRSGKMLKRQDATSLVHGDIVRRGISLQTNLGYRSMFFQDDRVHLSQVPINLIINPMDAVDGLWAQNNSEFGATFWFALPAHDEPQGAG